MDTFGNDDDDDDKIVSSFSENKVVVLDCNDFGQL